MALFSGVEDEPARHSGRGRRIGGWILTVSVLAACVFALVPSPYVIEQPGPVFNTLGTVEINGAEVPLIDVPTETTYPTGGALDLLTVSTLGDRAHMPNWFEVVTAWLDPSRAVLPIDLVYPPGYTIEDSNEDGRIQMANSQKDAIAAALRDLGHDIPSVVTVGALTDDSASKGILEPGDVLTTVGGAPVSDLPGLRKAIAASGAGNPLTIVIERNGETMTVSVTPKLSNDTPSVPLIGVYPSIDYTFPFEVKIQLENVGGPSGGQMFALGIIDKLTPGELNGGAKIAGTGTITADGIVGPIGGIRQKMFGAQRAGATWFLAPASNCNEVVGHVPDGLRVVPVSTLEDSLLALKKISSQLAEASLPSCAAAG